MTKTIPSCWSITSSNSPRKSSGASEHRWDPREWRTRARHRQWKRPPARPGTRKSRKSRVWILGSFQTRKEVQDNMKNKTLMTNSVLFILTGIFSFAGCGKKEPAEEQPVASNDAQIDTSHDANRKRTNTEHNLVVAGGDSATLFVYVKDGLCHRTFALP